MKSRLKELVYMDIYTFLFRSSKIYRVRNRISAIGQYYDNTKKAGLGVVLKIQMVFEDIVCKL